MRDAGCLYLALDGIECSEATPDADLCEPCHRARMAQERRSTDVAESAYLAGYARGYADGCGRGGFLDLEGLAAYLRGLSR